MLGINWAYIHYHENRKLVWETPLGEGKVLAIGGYLYFSEQNLNRSTLEIFIHNVFDYLAGSRPFSSAEKSWPCDSVTVEQATFPENTVYWSNRFRRGYPTGKRALPVSGQDKTGITGT